MIDVSAWAGCGARPLIFPPDLALHDAGGHHERETATPDDTGDKHQRIPRGMILVRLILPALDEIKTGIAYAVEREEGIIPLIGKAGAVYRERVVIMGINAGVEYNGIFGDCLFPRRRELVCPLRRMILHHDRAFLKEKDKVIIRTIRETQALNLQTEGGCHLKSPALIGVIHCAGHFAPHLLRHSFNAFNTHDGSDKTIHLEQAPVRLIDQRSDLLDFVIEINAGRKPEGDENVVVVRLIPVFAFRQYIS